jgi:sugar transferase (PEP-CTERM/EpsH1 system associated)
MELSGMSPVRRRILVVTPFLPSPWFGFGTRVFQLVNHLASRHDLTVVSFAKAEEMKDVDALRDVCRTVRTVPVRAVDATVRRVDQFRSLLSATPFHVQERWSPEMQRAIDDLMRKDGFDIVQLEGAQVCLYGVPSGVAVVLDEHNIEYEVLQRMSKGERTALRRLFSGVEYRKFRRVEQRAWQRVDAVSVTSDREVPVVRQHAPRAAIGVVPNGVDLQYFWPGGEECVSNSVVFVGTLDYRPNVDGVEFLLQHVLPILREIQPGVRVTVVGAGPESTLRTFRRAGIEVTGRVSDVRPYLAKAAVAVVPLRIGGGTRLKVIEALAMGKAVVSTTLGCEGLDVRHGEHVLLADSANAFAASVARLLADHTEARRLGSAGRALVVDRYSWTHSGQQLEALYDAILPLARRRDVAAE